LYPKFSTNIL